MKTAIGEHLLVTFFGVYEPREFILRSQLQEEMVMKNMEVSKKGRRTPKFVTCWGARGTLNPKIRDLRTKN